MQKIARGHGNGHGVEMATGVPWIAESKCQNRKPCMLRSRTHAHGQTEFQVCVGLEAQFCVRARVGTRSPLLSWPLWPSERNFQLEVPASMALMAHLQAARLGMILEFLLQNIALFWSRRNQGESGGNALLSKMLLFFGRRK